MAPLLDVRADRALRVHDRDRLTVRLLCVRPGTARVDTPGSCLLVAFPVAESARAHTSRGRTLRWRVTSTSSPRPVVFLVRGLCEPLSHRTRVTARVERSTPAAARERAANPGRSPRVGQHRIDPALHLPEIARRAGGAEELRRLANLVGLDSLALRDRSQCQDRCVVALVRARALPRCRSEAAVEDGPDRPRPGGLATCRGENRFDALGRADGVRCHRRLDVGRVEEHGRRHARIGQQGERLASGSEIARLDVEPGTDRVRRNGDLRIADLDGQLTQPLQMPPCAREIVTAEQDRRAGHLHGALHVVRRGRTCLDERQGIVEGFVPLPVAHLVEDDLGFQEPRARGVAEALRSRPALQMESCAPLLVAAPVVQARQVDVGPGDVG